MSELKIRVDRATLADAASWVAQVAPRTGNLPILGGLRLTAAGDRLSLRAFNYETSHEARVDADVLTPGEALVSARFFTEIVGQVKADSVDLVVDGVTLTIAAGRSTYRIRTMPVEDYPNLPDFPTPVGTIDKTALGDAVAAVDFAVLRDKAIASGELAVLGGIHLASGNHHGLVMPYYGASQSARPTEKPIGTLTTVDRYALIQRHNSSKGDGAEMVTPAGEYLRTLTTKGHQSVITPGDIAAAEAQVDDCLFRMLEPHEVAAGMAFPATYKWSGTRRERVKLAGNAVTPPAARDLIAAVAESLA